MMNRKHNIEDILDKGIELFRAQGYNNTGIEEILKATGIPKGSFYNFFRNKEDFGDKAMARYSERQNTYIETMLNDTSLSPFERLKKFYLSMIQFNEGESCSKGCLIGNLAQEMGGQSQLMSQAANRYYNNWAQLIANCIEEGQESGEIRDDISAIELGHYIHNSFNGSLMRAKAGQDAAPLHLFQKVAFEFLKK